jgi:hypothetical protein
MTDLREDEVFADLYPEEDKDKKKKKKPKIRSTDLYITINLNESFTTMSPERKLLFKTYAVKLFDQRGILSFVSDEEDLDNPLANIDKVEVVWRPEVGTQKKRLHLHAFVGIEHHGFLTFEANQLRADAEAVFGHKIHLDCKYGSNARLRWISYLNKS